MPNYSFNKTEVLNTLRANRENHRAIFEEALEGYRKFAIKEFENRIKAIKAGKMVYYVSLTQPSDHTKDYDRIISLLEMAEGDFIPLDERQFAQYIQDDWDWKQQSLTANSTYSMTASRQLADTDED
jgi:hypothetical protein